MGPYGESDDASALPLPAALEHLIETGVWGCLRGVAGGPSRDSLFDEALGWHFAVLGPPFATFQRFARPPDLNSPENKLLRAIFGAEKHDPMFAFEDGVTELGLDQLEPSLVLALAENDAYDYPTVILDYRDNPPTVRVRQRRTFAQERARWPIAGVTFDDWAAHVGLAIDGPLHWTPGPQDPSTGSSPASDPDGCILDHQHRLGARIIARGHRPTVVECHVRGEVIHTCIVSRNAGRDVTGPMKRALVEILNADDEQRLLARFRLRFKSSAPYTHDS